MINIRRQKNNRNYLDPHSPRYSNFDIVSHTHHTKNTIKIVSYNIKFSKKIKNAIHLFHHNEDLRNSDILCLQEMDPFGVELMAKALHYNFVYYPAVNHPAHGKDFGNAILSKWPIINDKKWILPHPKTHYLQRIAVSANISINNHPITIYCLHLKVFLEPLHRRNQILHLLKSLPHAMKHCIIAGDFNTFTKQNHKVIVDTFIEEKFQWATENIGWSFKHWYLLNKKSHLDHIFSKGLQIVNTGKIINRKASDHLPVWVELQLPSTVVG